MKDIKNEELKQYTNTHSLDDLNSEDLMKLFEFPYLEEEIIKSFNSNKNEFKKIRKKLEINNIYLESIIRNMIVILYYIYEKDLHIEDTFLQTLINTIKSSFCSVLPKRDFYEKKLDEINWIDVDVSKEIKIKKIDLSYRINRLTKQLEAIDNLINFDNKERFKDPYYDKKTYQELKRKKERGSILNKNDLTYDLVYQLAINENVKDSAIAELFDLTKQQIKYIRKKYDLENTYMKRLIDHPEIFRRYLIRKRRFFDENDLEEIFNENILYAIEKNKWSMTTYYRYKEQKRIKDNQINEENNKFKISVSYYEYKKKTNNSNKKTTSGKRSNQKQSSINKIEAGKFGEKIVYDYEKEKLKNLGLLDLVDKVNWITKTEDKDVTLDGLGYDIESFNEKGEKIYIEVKTSTTNNSNNVEFNISSNEVKLITGENKKINKENCYIYYVSKINNEIKKADIKIIDYKEFSKMNLKPTMYKVS